MTRRKDRYQPRAASASQPKTLKTYACARDCKLIRHVEGFALGPRAIDVEHDRFFCHGCLGCDLDKYKWGAAIIVMIAWLLIVAFGKILIRRRA